MAFPSSAILIPPSSLAFQPAQCFPPKIKLFFLLCPCNIFIAQENRQRIKIKQPREYQMEYIHVAVWDLSVADFKKKNQAYFIHRIHTNTARMLSLLKANTIHTLSPVGLTEIVRPCLTAHGPLSRLEIRQLSMHKLDIQQLQNVHIISFKYIQACDNIILDTGGSGDDACDLYYPLPIMTVKVSQGTFKINFHPMIPRYCSIKAVFTQCTRE